MPSSPEPHGPKPSLKPAQLQTQCPVGRAKLPSPQREPPRTGTASARATDKTSEPGGDREEGDARSRTHRLGAQDRPGAETGLLLREDLMGGGCPGGLGRQQDTFWADVKPRASAVSFRDRGGERGWGLCARGVPFPRTPVGWGPGWMSSPGPVAEKARPKPSQTGSNDFNPGEFLPPEAASCSQAGLGGPPNLAATSPGQGWMRPRGLHLLSPPSPTAELGRGNPTAPPIPHRDRSRGAPTAVATAPGSPQTPRTPISRLVTCAAGTGAQ